MTPLQRLQARIDELETARSAIQSALDTSPPAHTQPVSTVDWEARLSAARAVDTLTGANTAATLEAQRQSERLAAEKQARKAAQEAAQATQQREALSTVTRDLEAAQALYELELRAAAAARIADFEAGYHRAQAALREATQNYAAMLFLAGQETAAHQLLRAAGVTGDTMTVIANAATQLRAQLLEEPDHA